MILILFSVTIFLLSGLQAHLQILPLPIPQFWFIILTYYSFKKNLFFSLIANFMHSFIICSFSSIFIGSFLLIINVLTFFFVLIGEKFKIENNHITLASGIGLFFFYLFDWYLQSLGNGFLHPPIFQWITTGLVTLIMAPPIILFFDKINRKIEFNFKRIEVLKNLRP